MGESLAASKQSRWGWAGLAGRCVYRDSWICPRCRPTRNEQGQLRCHCRRCSAAPQPLGGQPPTSAHLSSPLAIHPFRLLLQVIADKPFVVVQASHYRDSPPQEVSEQLQLAALEQRVWQVRSCTVR